MDGELRRVEEAMRQRCNALLESLQQQQQQQQENSGVAHAAEQDPTAVPQQQQQQQGHDSQPHSQALLEELLSLHRASKLQLQQLQASGPAADLQAAAGPSGALSEAAGQQDGQSELHGQLELHAAITDKRDQTIQDLRLQLDAHAQTLATTLSRAESLIKAARSLTSPPPPLPSPEDILTLGHRIRYTTFAHAGLISLPPAPQQAQMLNSSLFHFSQQRAADALPTALTAVTLKPKAPAQPSSAQQPPAAGPALPQLPFPSSWKPGDPLPQLPPMPDNWKPGDPLPDFPQGFQLPLNIPDMPAGWQPGDPLPLPPPAAGAQPMDVDADAAHRRPAPQPAAGGGGLAAAKPEILSFLLNPDLEVADYSSDEDDSDDEFS